MYEIKNLLIVLMLITSIGIASAFDISTPITPLTIGGIASSGYVKVERGVTTYAPVISIPYTTTIDSNCADGFCRSLFGGVSILNSAKVALWSSPSWIPITTDSPWIYNVPAISFPADGKYYIVGIIAETAATYTSSVWTQVSSNVAQESITVEVVSPLKVVVSSSVASIPITNTVQMTGTVYDNAATSAVMTGKTISWTTSNAAVATVSATGLVTGVNVGSATITATHVGLYNTFTASKVITVTAPGVTISPPTSAIAAFISAIWEFLRSLFPFLPANM